MHILLLALVILFFSALLVGYVRNRRYAQRGEETPAPREARPAGCCGQHEVCEKESLLTGISRDVEYYDDEELDRFRARPDDSYTDAEVEEFQTILLTMREDEVAGWVRSLALRGVALPRELRDDVCLIVGERRTR